MIRCRECVIPDTRPDTAFVDGICAACIAYKRRPEVDWLERQKLLEQLAERARAEAKMRGNAFDCIVPSSGGKDSTYQVVTLIELGLRPLAVTASTCHLTPIGRRNIENLKRFCTTIEVSPPTKARATLNRIGLSHVGDISWPEHVSIFTTPFKVAIAMGIPFLFYGENPQSQYGGPLEEQEARTMTARWVSEFGGFLGMRPRDMIGQEDLTAADLDDYMPPDWERAKHLELEAHFLGQYIPWNSHHNALKARHHGLEVGLPTQANLWTHENLDNAHTGIHDHLMYRKYGYGRGAAQASVDVRAGLMDRDQALAFVAEHDGLFPTYYSGVFYSNALERIGMREDTFREICRRFTNWELFKPGTGEGSTVSPAGARPVLA